MEKGTRIGNLQTLKQQGKPIIGCFPLYPPLEYMARTQNCYVCPHGMMLRNRAMAEAVKRLNIDGVVFASNRSCKPYSVTQMGQQRIMSEKSGIPSIMIDVDHADVRKYSREGTFTHLEALLETIDSRRAA
jgi:benzoyl-CoA reductase/2-hydroxyglutaryl-CoA dehydratase subunit BcrC/BadD/HgdB